MVAMVVELGVEVEAMNMDMALVEIMKSIMVVMDGITLRGIVTDHGSI